MSWLNYGTHGWQIDHIIPLASTNDYFERIKLHHYSNLRPMWAKHNQTKGSRKLWRPRSDSNFAVALATETLRLNISEGQPFSAATARLHGCSSALMSYHEKLGTVARLGRGAFMFSNDRLDFCHSVALLQEIDPTTHLGGESAIKWHQKQQLKSIPEPLVIYTQSRRRFPEWFTDSFHVEHIQRNPFVPTSTALRTAVAQLGTASSRMNVALNELAFIQVVSDVGVRLSLQRAGDILAPVKTIDLQTLVDLLEQTRSVKVQLLVPQISEMLDLPWSGDLRRRWKPRSAGRRWTRKCKDGTYLNIKGA